MGESLSSIIQLGFRSLGSIAIGGGQREIQMKKGPALASFGSINFASDAMDAGAHVAGRKF
jgi:hypothetical protein